MSLTKAVGIDLGGTSVKGVLIDSDGEILKELHRETDFNIESLDNPLHWANVVKQVREELTDGQDLTTGISAPGLAANDERSIAIMPGRFPGLEGFAWPEFLDTNKVCVLNDAKSALVAEATLGAGKGHKDMILLTLGTGVGGAIMIDGKLYKGTLDRAGHLGHISLDIDGPVGITNIPGSLETAIGNATVSERTSGAFDTTFDLIKAVEDGDTNARECWLLSVRKLAAGLCSLINVLSPELVILGGGISRAGDILMDNLDQYMEKYEWRPDGNRTPIRIAKYLEMSGALGAACYAINRTNESL